MTRWRTPATAKEPAAPPAERTRSWRGPLCFVLAFAVVLAALVLPFLPDGGPRELYDRTIGYQAGRPSPFSVWGQVEGLDWLQTRREGRRRGARPAGGVRPRRRDARQVAALGAAVLIVLELTMTHWFYLYVVWFVPFVFAGRSAARTVHAVRRLSRPTRRRRARPNRRRRCAQA